MRYLGGNVDYLVSYECLEFQRNIWVGMQVCKLEIFQSSYKFSV